MGPFHLFTWKGKGRWRSLRKLLFIPDCFAWVTRNLSCAVPGEGPLSWGFPAALLLPNSDLCPDVPWGEVAGRRAWCRGAVVPSRLLSLPRVFQIESNSLRFGFITMPMWDKNSIMSMLKIWWQNKLDIWASPGVAWLNINPTQVDKACQGTNYRQWVLQIFML